ncbi:hypothetical protein CEXT_548831 [Caerostris extrusa]|uniref:Uncharacterized protein n=1 Tax=Caerostris extrusa TaxID=172846 RepID=A0AAV4XHY5_CAEEX|nr:hypothetical protein CEXT_548831 [Caerostris extrusa]
MLTSQSVLTSCTNTGPKREGKEKKKRLSRSQAVYTHFPCDSLPASFVCAMVVAAGLRDSASPSSAEFGHLATPACGKGTGRVDGGTAEQHRTHRVHEDAPTVTQIQPRMRQFRVVTAEIITTL